MGFLRIQAYANTWPIRMDNGPDAMPLSTNRAMVLVMVNALALRQSVLLANG